MRLTLGFSPCPNDTFIFDAIVNQKIDTLGLEFDIILEDVEALNQMAVKEELNITKLSYHAFAYLTDKYLLLDSGSALGNNCGPLLIAKKPISLGEMNPNASIAIPGKLTTANFLLGLALPSSKNKTELLFSEIESAVLNETVEFGLIIHENRFTYQQKGLYKVVDLGSYWETLTKLPIPLGGIVIQKSLPPTIQQKVNTVLKNSVQYAMENPAGTKAYVSQYAQEMDEAVMFQHINLYVNQFTLDLGEKGQMAINQMFDMAFELKLIPNIKSPIFLNPLKP